MTCWPHMNVDQLFACQVGTVVLAFVPVRSLAALEAASRGAQRVVVQQVTLAERAASAESADGSAKATRRSPSLRRPWDLWALHLSERQCLGRVVGRRLAAASGHSLAVAFRSGGGGGEGGGAAVAFGSLCMGQCGTGSIEGSELRPARMKWAARPFQDRHSPASFTGGDGDSGDSGDSGEDGIVGSGGGCKSVGQGAPALVPALAPGQAAVNAAAHRPGAVAVSAGPGRSYVVTAGGELFGCGRGSRLGVRQREPWQHRLVPVLLPRENCSGDSGGGDSDGGGGGAVVTTRGGIAAQWYYSDGDCVGDGDDGWQPKAGPSLTTTASSAPKYPPSPSPLRSPSPLASLALGRRVWVVAVSAGRSHALAVGDRGEVFSWGHGGSGRLGHGGGTGAGTSGAVGGAGGGGGGGGGGHRDCAARIEALRGLPCVAVAAGFAHSLVLTATGEVSRRLVA